MFRTRDLIFAVSALLPVVAAQDPASEPDAPGPQEVRSIDELCRYVESREAVAESFSMKLRTEGRMADGSVFRTSGTRRVLSTTHSHSQVTLEFGPEMKAETETVRTPEGIWMWERDPVMGEVFLRMDAATMRRIESAAEVLGDGDAEQFGLGSAARPLVAAMIRELDQQFELELSGPKEWRGVEVWTVAGALRGERNAGQGEDDEVGETASTGEADRVDLIVRVEDGVILSWTEFLKGAPILEVQVDEFEIQPKLAPASFVMEVPEDAELIDVLAHPPTQAQLERLFERARERGWKDPAAVDEEPSDAPADDQPAADEGGAESPDEAR